MAHFILFLERNTLSLLQQLLFTPEHGVASADDCPANFSTSADGQQQLVSLHQAGRVTLKMTEPGVITFASSGPGQCNAGAIVNVVVSQGGSHMLLVDRAGMHLFALEPFGWCRVMPCVHCIQLRWDVKVEHLALSAMMHHALSVCTTPRPATRHSFGHV